jgi:hypothetical protein
MKAIEEAWAYRKIAAMAAGGRLGVSSTRFRRPPRKLPVEMSFNFFMTKRAFYFGQYDGIDDFVAFDLSGEEHHLVQFLVGEFHSSAICKRFDPLVAHLAPQVAIQSR